MDQECHEEWISLAFKLAEEAYEKLEVPIGCVIVNSVAKTVISSGRNRTNETRNACMHAELDALLKLDSNFESIDFSKCILIVTIEPCIMCIAACRMIGLVNIWIGAKNERFGGCGSIIDADKHFMEQSIPPAIVQVIPGSKWRCMAIRLLRQFYIRENENAPNPKRKVNRILRTEDILHQE